MQNQFEGKELKKVGIGIIGLGTVGEGVWGILNRKKEELLLRSGIEIEIIKVCDINRKKKNSLKIPSQIFTDLWEEVVEDKRIGIIVELIGGLHPAKEIILSAIKKDKYIVTANKALLSEYGNEIWSEGRIFFEASVMSGVPVLKSIKEGLIANRIEKILGIINGTANYILTKMEEGKTYETALKEAQRKGFAEADPALDVEGTDSAHKLSVLSYLSFGSWVSPKDILVEGITSLTPEDLRYAKELGYTIKLLAIGKRDNNSIELRVHPTLLPLSHPLSNVKEEFNALLIKGDEVGEITFGGKGAGSYPTASAIVSDIIESAKSFVKREKFSRSISASPYSLKVVSPSELVLPYYLRFNALDEPGVLSSISGILGKKGISIEQVSQKGRKKKGAVPIVMMTHEAKEKSIKEAIKEIDKLPFIKKKTLLLRVENF